MGKSSEIKKVTPMVKEVLIKSVKARNSDAYLYCKIIEKISKGASERPFKEVIADVDLPKYDTVTRIRRKLQEKNPNLQGSDRVRDYRTENEEAFRKYARS